MRGCLGVAVGEARGYSDLPQAIEGSALYVLAFDRTPSAVAATSNAAAAGAGADTAAAAAAAVARVFSVWSTAGPCSIEFSAPSGCYEVVDMLGARRPGSTCATGKSGAAGILRVDNVTDAPLIVEHLAEAEAAGAA
jgi:hypothetical protein